MEFYYGGLVHDRRFVGGVFVLFLFVLIRISGRRRVAHDHEGETDQSGGNSSGCAVMLLLLGCGLAPLLLRLPHVVSAGELLIT